MDVRLQDFFKVECFLLLVSVDNEGFFSIMGGGGSSSRVWGSSPQVEYPSLPDSESLGFICNLSFSITLYAKIWNGMSDTVAGSELLQEGIILRSPASISQNSTSGTGASGWLWSGFIARNHLVYLRILQIDEKLGRSSGSVCQHFLVMFVIYFGELKGKRGLSPALIFLLILSPWRWLSSKGTFPVKSSKQTIPKL